MEEACKYGLTRGTCFVARRLEVVAVAGLLSIYFVVCFFSVWWDFVFFFFSIFFFFRTHTACCKYEAASCLLYLSMLVINSGRRHDICSAEPGIIINSSRGVSAIAPFFSY